ncbi:MAG TPA: hypothetical protein VHF86_04010, partial [Xanthomonadaceae bacterium]|nr:hypothetical protein [Xanthomonadaceae bacterium]
TLRRCAACPTCPPSPYSRAPPVRPAWRCMHPSCATATTWPSGSAQAAIAAQLAEAGRVPGEDGRYVGSQGRELGRDGRVEVRIDDDGEVWIGGFVQPVIDGMVAW